MNLVQSTNYSSIHGIHIVFLEMETKETKSLDGYIGRYSSIAYLSCHDINANILDPNTYKAIPSFENQCDAYNLNFEYPKKVIEAVPE